MAKTTKIRTVKRNRLPFGRYRYVVCFNVSIFDTRSSRFNLITSKNKPNRYKSSSQRRRIVGKFFKKFRRLVIKYTVFNFDEFYDYFNEVIIGKYYISYNFKRLMPLKVYLTDFEDITFLYFTYKKHIERIFKIELRENDIDFSLKDPKEEIEKGMLWFIETNQNNLYFRGYQEAAKKSIKLRLPLYQVLVAKSF